MDQLKTPLMVHTVYIVIRSLNEVVFLKLVYNLRTVDSFSNSGVIEVMDCLSLFLSSFLNPKNSGGVLAPPAPLLSTLLYLDLAGKLPDRK